MARINARERAVYADTIRQRVIDQSYRANVGHIGSALSIADLVAAVMGSSDRFVPGPDRDRPHPAGQADRVPTG